MDKPTPIPSQRTEYYARWFSRLKDTASKARIEIRVNRLLLGNPGDHKNLGGGVSELRIDCGPGYRVYYADEGGRIIILLAGGDKHRQSEDVSTARELLISAREELNEK